MEKIITYYTETDYCRVIYDREKDVTFLIIENDEAIGTTKLDNLQEIIFELIYTSDIEYVNNNYIDIFMNEILEIRFRQDEKPYVLDLLQQLYNFK